MKDLSGMHVSENICCYMLDRASDDRYASFDYCFNYFQSFREQGRVECICSPECVQQTCLQLGFYLASWGMLRGSTILLNKSARFCRRVLEVIVRCDARLWEIDLPYTDKDIELLLGFGEELCEALENKASDTLVTKIMLGVFANVPAFDDLVKTGFGIKHIKNALDEVCLWRVTEFYEQNRTEIDGYRPIYTFDFCTGQDTQRRYTKAKIVDMVGWVEGGRIKPKK
jgi:hypothetical protein